MSFEIYQAIADIVQEVTPAMGGAFSFETALQGSMERLVARGEDCLFDFEEVELRDGGLTISPDMLHVLILDLRVGYSVQTNTPWTETLGDIGADKRALIRALRYQVAGPPAPLDSLFPTDVQPGAPEVISGAQGRTVGLISRIRLRASFFEGA